MNRLAKGGLNALKGVERNPSVVVADLDVGVACECLVDGDLGALVQSEQLRSAAVGRGRG